jgi:hypothetical protein
MSEEKEGVDVKPLLEAVARRGGTQPGDPRIGLFETLRTAATWTGQVYEAQLVTLKRNAMLIMGSKVVLGIDTDKRHVTYSGGPAPRGFERNLGTVQQMMESLVCQVLGPKWTVERGTIKQDDPRPASKSRKPAKSKGKRGARKARKR